jgi:filamentous hemagglutinin family protein
MKNKYFLLTISILPISLNLSADVITDGSLGPIVTLTGSELKIDENLGYKVGSNLFHSFQEFNLNASQIATFTGQEVTNLLARVTGEQSSSINGTIRSEIPFANLYLLNPHGILFGESAHLETSGAFHVSSADYIRLGPNGYFFANNSQNSVLTAASPEAFGFLNHPAPIQIQGSYLKATPEQTLSFIGGDLLLKDSILFASSGRINLVAVASAGEVTFPDMAVDSFEKLGKITLSQESSSQREKRSTEEMLREIQMPFSLANLDVSDLLTLTGKGQIFIRAGQFYLDNGSIFADTYGNNDLISSEINIFVDGDMYLTRGARITADNYGDTPGGHIHLTTTNKLSFSGQVSGQDLKINDLSAIATNSKYGTGNGGEIHINTPILEMQLGLIQAATQTVGNAGKIFINALQITLREHGYINASTVDTGQAGYIDITTETLSLVGHSSISGSTSTNSSGNANSINITTQILDLKGGQIINASLGSGNAGTIHVTANNAFLSDKSIIASLATQGSGSDIHLHIQDQLQMNDSLLVTRTESSKPQNDAGNVVADTEKFTLGSSRLLANANIGDGGNINIITNQFNVLGDSWIDISSKYGVNGQLLINSVNVGDKLGLNTPQFTPKSFSLSLCNNSIAGSGRLLIKDREGLLSSPEDLQTN